MEDSYGAGGLPLHRCHLSSSRGQSGIAPYPRLPQAGPIGDKEHKSKKGTGGSHPMRVLGPLKKCFSVETIPTSRK
jgi:hypothetical protein